MEKTIMDNSDTKLQELQEALQKVSIRLSRIEEIVISPQDCFSHSYFGEMTRSLSMPGLRFIGEKFQHGIHTYLWLLIHTVALLISYVYIKEEYDNWQSSPVIRTLSNNLTFVHEIPFPAITMCVPFSLNGDYDFLKYLQKCISCQSNAGGNDSCSFNGDCDKMEMETLAVASLVCAEFVSACNVSEPPSEVFARDFNKSVAGELYKMYAQKVFPPCDYVIKQNKNEDKEYLSGCDKNGFQYFLAYGAFGLCTTFNGLRHQDIYKRSTVATIPMQPIAFDKRYIGGNLTLENMLYYKGSNDTVPSYFTDEDWFKFIISKRENQVYQNVCNFFTSDIVASVVLHNPAEIPLFQDVEQTVKLNYYNYLKVTPKLVTTKKDLSTYSPIQRGCYYSHERELMMFNRYSENSCDVECSVNCSLKTCNCVPYYLPRPTTSQPVCLSECKINCDCGCLPDCVSLSYEFDSRKEVKETNGTGLFFVYYKSNKFYPMIRVGISNLADFMAYSFGILGTFNGFCVMVIFELLYFVTVRLWCSIKTYLIPQNSTKC